MEEEEFQEPPPPTPEKVARRALVLSAVTCRSMIDDKQDPWAKEMSTQILEWLERLDLKKELSEWEKALLTKPFGELSEKDRRDGSWLSEAMVILAWALGKTPLPSFDAQCDPPDVGSCLGFTQPIVETALSSPQLLPREQLSEYNEFIYNLHWRVRDHRLRGGPYDFESLARKAWGEPILRHGLKIIDKDIALGGIPLTQAPESARRSITSITQERHRASNWLIGYASEDFYEVTTDT